MTARSPLFDRTRDSLYFGGLREFTNYNLFASGEPPDYFIGLFGKIVTNEYSFPIGLKIHNSQFLIHYKKRAHPSTLHPPLLAELSFDGQVAFSAISV